MATAVPARGKPDQTPGSPRLLFSGPRVHLGGPGRVAGWTGPARGEEEGRAERASPVFPGRLQGAIASLPLWPVGPTDPPLRPQSAPRTPFRADARRARRQGAGAGGHSWLPAPLLPHAQPAAAHAFDLSCACATPAPACRFMLGQEPSPPSPSFCTQRALQPLGPLCVLSPVWSGTCLQVKQYLRVLYIQPLL